ncbi:unnamed protein product [Allacma fusca]|uniref:Uncharacterized protein n=1 Tax=Allacma fusca TaxID=39272 RepID=A0A8J2KGM3_9HEXA|nr:unnamed protein product [Allacma fusca]
MKANMVSSVLCGGAQQLPSIHSRSISNSPSVLIRSGSQSILEPSAVSITSSYGKILSVEPRKEVSAADGDHDEDADNFIMTKEEIWNVAPAIQRSYNFGPYANESKVIQELVHLGVEIHRWEEKFGIPEFVLKLDFEKNIAPYITFLCDHGVHADDVGNFFTKNPFILKENLQNLERRIAYLRSKKFEENAIAVIISRNPFWLVFSTKRIDRRLGFFQEYFALTGAQVRQLATSGPKLITDKIDRVKEITFTLKEECGFEPDEIKKLLLSTPFIFRKYGRKQIWLRFDYLHNEVKFTHEQILKWPKILTTNRSRVKARIGFLQQIGRAQFNPEKPNFVSFRDIFEKDDAIFATQVAHSSVHKYNEYLKSV